MEHHNSQYSNKYCLMHLTLNADEWLNRKAQSTQSTNTNDPFAAVQTSSQSSNRIIIGCRHRFAHTYMDVRMRHYTPRLRAFCVCLLRVCEHTHTHAPFVPFFVTCSPFMLKTPTCANRCSECIELCDCISLRESAAEATTTVKTTQHNTWALIVNKYYIRCARSCSTSRNVHAISRIVVLEMRGVPRCSRWNAFAQPECMYLVCSMLCMDRGSRGLLSCTCCMRRVCEQANAYYSSTRSTHKLYYCTMSPSVVAARELEGLLPHKISHSCVLLF